MAKISTLYLLVNSLSKGEKRYFRLHTSLQRGDKDYIILFNIIEKGLDTENIASSFKSERPKASLEVAAKYLFKVITDCLLYVKADQNLVNSLVTGILKANILFEKSLYEEGFHQLDKMISMAKLFEQHWIQLWACKMELFYLSNLNFYSVSEKELLDKQLRIDALMKYSANLRQHSSLYELFRHRLLYKGNVRTASQKEQLNDLVISELNIVSKLLDERVESRKTHLLFQAHYFMSVSDYKSALSTFYELIEVLETHSFLWMDTPIEYLTTVEGILDTLHAIQRYEDMHFFLNKIRDMKKPSVYFDVMVTRVLFIYEIVSLLDVGKFTEADALKVKYEKELFKRLHLLDIGKQADVYLFVSIIYIGTGNIKKSHFYLDKVLIHHKLFYSLPVYRTFRLLNLIVHFELGNTEYIEYEIRSIKRMLHISRNKSYVLEKMIFKFLSKINSLITPKSKLAFYEKLQNDFADIIADRYSIQMLKIFDFMRWIESKLKKRSFAELLRQKSHSIKKSN